ncbi:MAG TPA: FtsX-like permease family protein [Candidatus Polarisedimenticolia bacterium]|nr:FtsX-like permease family protein [Candidatus Polarisedimenticolia bacterium]
MRTTVREGRSLRWHRDRGACRAPANLSHSAGAEDRLFRRGQGGSWAIDSSLDSPHVTDLIARVGIYGVMSFSVSQRTQELGVRMALGADSRRILRMVLRQGSLVTAIGLGIGLLLTLGVVMIAGTGIQSVLFGVSARDPLIYVTVVALVGIVSLAATVVPARRATRVDPMIALRAE